MIRQCRSWITCGGTAMGVKQKLGIKRRKNRPRRLFSMEEHLASPARFLPSGKQSALYTEIAGEFDILCLAVITDGLNHI
jgi:hypothetical protein